nr:uncharacterized protein LOC111417878 [Onthophagus taurus]
MFLELYNKYNYELADPRTNDFLLMTSPFKVLAILALYLWFCLKAGPHFMKDRKPFQLRKTLVVYNLIQIILSAIFFNELLMMWLYVYDLRCTPVDYSVNPKNTYLMFIGHTYFLSKISELLDTVFFVLRKKDSQITTLHLYHHTIMVAVSWVVFKYMAGGQAGFVILINSFVHIVMYTYYLLAGLGPKFKKYLTWKKQITQLQLVQFVILLIYNLQALPRECDYPKIMHVFQIVECLIFIYMFSSFYVKAYNTKKQLCQVLSVNNTKMFEVYQYINYDLSDPRTKDIFLMSSPFPILSILGLYLWFCLKAGPHFMKNREPFKLKNTLIVYNVFQIITSAFFFVEASSLWLFKYNLSCEPVDYSNNPDAVYVLHLTYIYFLSKVIELLDTIFFILRKKYSQVTTLHLYHHASTAFIIWVTAKYVGGGQATFAGFLNSFVHIIMYTYYLIAGLGPKYQKYLTWKKYITQIQLIQFLIIFIKGMQAIFTNCNFPKSHILLQISEAVLFFYMFSSFYSKQYNKQQKLQ